MRLTELNPKWIDTDGRHGLGVEFNCLLHFHTLANGERGECWNRIVVLFTNPLDGFPAWEGNCRDLIEKIYPADATGNWSHAERRVCCGSRRWTRTGMRFFDLSLTPSVDADRCGRMTLTNGEWR